MCACRKQGRRDAVKIVWASNRFLFLRKKDSNECNNSTFLFSHCLPAGFQEFLEMLFMNPLFLYNFQYLTIYCVFI